MPTDKRALTKYRKDLIRALKRLDWDWFRSHMDEIGMEFTPAKSEVTGQWMSAEEILEMSVHQVRYEVQEVPKKLRDESREWLTARGFLRLRMRPWN
jgi:hypothetical protein